MKCTDLIDGGSSFFTQRSIMLIAATLLQLTTTFFRYFCAVLVWISFFYDADWHHSGENILYLLVSHLSVCLKSPAETHPLSCLLRAAQHTSWRGEIRVGWIWGRASPHDRTPQRLDCTLSCCAFQSICKARVCHQDWAVYSSNEEVTEKRDCQHGSLDANMSILLAHPVFEVVKEHENCKRYLANDHANQACAAKACKSLIRKNSKLLQRFLLLLDKALCINDNSCNNNRGYYLA